MGTFIAQYGPPPRPTLGDEWKSSGISRSRTRIALGCRCSIIDEKPLGRGSTSGLIRGLLCRRGPQGKKKGPLAPRSDSFWVGNHRSGSRRRSECKAGGTTGQIFPPPGRCQALSPHKLPSSTGLNATNHFNALLVR